MNLVVLTQVMERRLSGAQEGPEFYFFIAGLQRWRALRSSSAYDQSDTARQLTRLVDEGPDVGIHLIVWTDSMTSVEHTFTRSGLQYFDLRVGLRLPEGDSTALFGNRIASTLQDNQALFRHENWELGRVEKFKPYEILDRETIDDLACGIREKWSHRQ